MSKINFQYIVKIQLLKEDAVSNFENLQCVKLDVEELKFTRNPTRSNHFMAFKQSRKITSIVDYDEPKL